MRVTCGSSWRGMYRGSPGFSMAIVLVWSCGKGRSLASRRLASSRRSRVKGGVFRSLGYVKLFSLDVILNAAIVKHIYHRSFNPIFS